MIRHKEDGKNVRGNIQLLFIHEWPNALQNSMPQTQTSAFCLRLYLLSMCRSILPAVETKLKCLLVELNVKCRPPHVFIKC